MNKKIILISLLTLMMAHTAVNSLECSNSEDVNYEVSMRYVDYNELDSADLPPRQRFNLNAENEEDQALEYQNGTTDTIITIRRSSKIARIKDYMDLDGTNVQKVQEEVKLLDDTGFYTAHFLMQDLMEKANENGEIDPEEHKQQIKRISEQLEKFKELVEEIAKFDIVEFGTTAADVEDSIGNEWFEGDGVLDVLDKKPINVNELATHWKVLMNNVSSARDMRVQVYALDEYSGHWNTIDTPSAWREIQATHLLPMYTVKASQDAPVVGKYSAGAKVMESTWTGGYFASRAATNQPLDVLLYPGHCTTVNPRIMGQPRSIPGHIKNYFFRNEKKNINSSQGGHSVQ